MTSCAPDQSFSVRLPPRSSASLPPPSSASLPPPSLDQKRHVDENIIMLHQLLDNYRAPYADYSLMIARYLLPLQVAIYDHEDNWVILTTLLARGCRWYDQDPDSRLVDATRFILGYWVTHDRHQRIIANQTYVWSSAAITHPRLLTIITGSITDHYLNLFLALSHHRDDLPSGFRDNISTLLSTWDQYYQPSCDDYQAIRYLYHEMSQSMERSDDLDLVDRYLDDHRRERPSWMIPSSSAPSFALSSLPSLPPDPISDIISYLSLRPSKHDYRIMMETYCLAPLPLRLKILYPLYGESIPLEHESEELVELPPNPYGITRDHLAQDQEWTSQWGPPNGINYPGVEGRMLYQYSPPSRCEMCKQTVPPREGLRCPLPQTGWMGWYCSFPCLEEAILPFLSHDLTLLPRLTTFKRVILQYGIYNQV